ncbi:MAG: hypothetical protein HOE90_07110 [Bacteriovoracaceae bacterium]|jgi:tetratricopeptide (TPR) repeat protein|nr:hypothetical protein [Bacteriovoracaceae bacterium]
MFKLIVLITLLIPQFSFAGYRDASLIFGHGTRGNVNKFGRMVVHLVEAGNYYASIPLIKEYMTSTGGANLTPELDMALDEIILNVGVRQFELLPVEILSRSNSPSVNYILAKKFFRIGKYKKALKYIRGMNDKHSMAPFARLLEGSAYSILGLQRKSIDMFKRCIAVTDDSLGQTSDKLQVRQLLVTKDECLIGIARAHFAAKRYERSNLTYLDLPKSSFVWPDILFEEAWNSYYRKNYNRTLGKLVTYSAPVLDHIFNPEIHILEALSYMELCLYGDAKKVVDSFYKRYLKRNQRIAKFIKSNGRDYNFYYKLGRLATKGPIKGNRLLNRFMKSIVHGATYNDLIESLMTGRHEFSELKKLKRTPFNTFLLKNTLDSLKVQKKLVGSYVRRRLVVTHLQVKKAFQQMSYIKLEVLARRKADLFRYTEEPGERKRGDVKFISRNEKQYFWTFNGEFWVDELGDYVFALGNECR